MKTNAILMLFWFLFLHGTIVIAVTCPPGRGGIDCVLCTTGTYSQTWGNEPCISCPKGTFSNRLGAVSKEQCVFCALNTYSSFYHDYCKDCPDNTVSPVASNSITDCVAKAGFYGVPGKPCPINTHCPGNTMQPIPCAYMKSCIETNAIVVVEEVKKLNLTDYIVITTWVMLVFFFTLCVLGGTRLFTRKRVDRSLHTIHISM